MASVVLEFGFVDGVKQIAFAQRRPIKAITVIKEHFVSLRDAGGALRTAHQDVDLPFIGDALRMRDDYGRMSLRPVGGLETKDVPGFH
jgi:hypothetical protein